MSYEHERNILGCLLKDVGSFAYEILDPSDFMLEQHGRIYEHLAVLHNKGKPIDIIGVGKKTGMPVAELAGILANSLDSTFEGCVESVKNESAKRKYDLIMAEHREGDIDEVIDGVVTELQSINLYRTNKSKNMSSIGLSYLELLASRSDNAGKELRSGLYKLDKTLGAFNRKEFTIIGARPSVGKSALGLQIAVNIAKKHTVLFVSLEMADVQIMERLVARFGDVEHQKLKTGDLESSEYKSVLSAICKAEELNLKIDTTIRTVGQLRTKILSDRPEIVIVDYIGLMTDTSKRFRDKREEMSSITHKIKQMALDYDIPIVALAQLGRSAQNKIPNLSELRDSGSLEEDADNVIFLHQIQDGDKDWFPTAQGITPMLIMVEKQRNGERLWIKAAFNGKKFTFMEVTN